MISLFWLPAVQRRCEQSYQHQQLHHLHDGEVGRGRTGDEEIGDSLWDRQGWRHVYSYAAVCVCVWV